jgi:hypothetical protein
MAPYSREVQLENDESVTVSATSRFFNVDGSRHNGLAKVFLVLFFQKKNRLRFY